MYYINNNKMSKYIFDSAMDMIYSNETKPVAYVLIGLFYFLIPFLIWKLILKKRAIRKPINNESYCVISIHICNMAIISLSF